MMSKLMSSRMGRREQLSQQEKLIEQRKREIEDKLKQSSKEINTSNCELKSELKIDCSVEPIGDNQKQTTSPIDIEEKVSVALTPDLTPDPIPSPINPLLNKFKNDGSFFEQFLRMKRPEEQNQPNTDSNIETTAAVNETKADIKPIKMIVKENKTKLKAVHSVIDSNVKLIDDNNTVSPSEDKDIQSAIERTAISVAMNGTEAEETMRRTRDEDIHYSWLSDKDSEDYKYFQLRVKQLSEAKERAQNDNSLPSEETELESDSNKGTKRQRKSRWSDEKVEVKLDAGLIQYAMQVFGSTDISSEQWKQLEDQRKMKVLCQLMEQKQANLRLMANAGKVQYDYDSDEDITDGTWEHKRRRQEMTQTQRIANELTESATGKHHIGDFMPPEELEKFMQKWDSVKEGLSLSSESDYKDFKLQSDNVGFQMLKKLGWVEGQGLGSTGSGIAEPVNKSGGGSNNSGLGQIRPEDLKEGDDEYEAYRKRMMLAYRFRPNPMNNPRRSYY